MPVASGICEMESKAQFLSDITAAGQNILASEDNAILPATNDTGTRIRKRHRKQPGQSRSSLGHLLPRFKYLPEDLKKALRKTYTSGTHPRSQSGDSAPSQQSNSPTAKDVFVVKETKFIPSKDGVQFTNTQTRTQSTHQAVWEANVALLQLLHDNGGRRKGLQFVKSRECAGVPKKSITWWIDEDASLKAGYGKEKGWHGWSVERRES